MKSQWGAGIPDDWGPAKVIPKPQYEAYARARLAGAGPSAAYRAHVARSADVRATSVKSAAHHLERHAAIAARIEWLRRAKTEELETDSRPLTGPALRQLMEICTTALMDATTRRRGLPWPTCPRWPSCGKRRRPIWGE